MDSENNIAPPRIALVGNPNCGKTTLFNRLTGGREKVGNYPGVTVEKTVGRAPLADGRRVQVIDLPGAYSLIARSPDERITRDVLLDLMPGMPRPDLIVNVVESISLERNLYFSSQLIELGLPVVIALTMTDRAAELGIVIEAKGLAAELGVPVIPVSGLTGAGLPDLLAAIADPEQSSPARRGLPEPLATEARGLADFLRERGTDPAIAFARAGVLIGRENDADDPWNADAALRARIDAARARLAAGGRDWRSELVERRYARINALCERFVRRPEITGRSRADRVDAILMHPVLGWGFFALALAAVFFVVFSVAHHPMEWIDAGFVWLAEILRARLPEGILRDLLADGVVPGVGGVLIFLPQILGLFLILGLLEDSGLMARGAFIVDRLMSRVGLHGKSFIPLMSSFACAVPGIMATRTIEERRPRLATIFIAPFMCCSARLPVYLLMIGALIPNRVLDPLTKSFIMSGLYLFGITAAFATARILNRAVLSGPPLHLILELPPYRRPSPRAVLRMVGERGAIFLTKAGTVILAFSIVLWALMTWPRLPEATPGEALRHSFAGRLGQAIEPVIEPLGFDWRIGVGIISSFVAREVFVSTMGIVFNIEEADEANPSLLEALRRAAWPDGRPLVTPIVAIGLMIFYALAMQCVATMAAVKVETGGWRWPLLQFAWMTGFAWIAVFLFRQVALAAGWT